MALSYGFVETLGLTGSLEAADAMLKAAKVHIVQRREVGAGLVTVVVEGELGAVQAAVDAGRAAAERLGQFVTSHVIPRPFDDTEGLVAGTLGPVSTGPVDGTEKKPPVTPARKTAPPAKPAKKSPPKKRSPKKKKAIKGPPVMPPKQETPTENADAIMAFLGAGKDGATLEEIATETNLDSAKARVVLKGLIDEGRVEKVKQLYYPLPQRG